MRVALVTGDPRAGLAHYTSRLANALSELSDVTLVSPCGPIEDYLSGDVGKVFVDCGDLSPGPKLLRALSIPRIISRLAPDVVHLQSYPPLLLPVIPFVPRPLVVTLHDPTIHPGARNAWALASCRSLVLRRADRLVVHAEVHRQTLTREGLAAESIDVIPHGDYRFFRDLAYRRPARKGSRVLFFGAISPYKGLEVLLDAAHRVIRRRPETVFVIAGRGDLRPYRGLLPRESNLDIHNYYIPDREVARIFGEATIVVLPYIEASQSGVLAIAQAFGLPIIASKVGGLPEAIADGRDGVLVEPGDPVALARAIDELLSDPQKRQSLGRRALRRQRRECSWEKVAAMVLACYERALGDRASAGPGTPPPPEREASSTSGEAA